MNTNKKIEYFEFLIELLKSIGWTISDLKGLQPPSHVELYARAFPPNGSNKFINIKTNKDIEDFLLEYKTSFPDEVVNNIESTRKIGSLFQIL